MIDDAPAGAARTYALTPVAGEHAICRLESGAPLPAWAEGADGVGFIGRTPEALSILVPASRVPAGLDAARGWHGFVVDGPFPFETVGVMAALSAALADAGVSLLAFSTYDTDYLFVQARDRDRAIAAWRSRGHLVRD